MATFLLALLAGIAGCALGWVAAAALAIGLGGYFGLSDFEGQRAMTAIFAIGPIGGLIGLVVGFVWTVTRRHRPGSVL